MNNKLIRHSQAGKIVKSEDVYLKKILQVMLLLVLFFSFNISFSQTVSIASGNWSSASNWSNGVPNNGNDTVKHAMVLDGYISISSGSLTIKAPVTDPVGSPVEGISLSNSGVLDVNGNLKVGGGLSMSNTSTIIVRNGDTLMIGDPGGNQTTSISNSTTITVEAGGVLILNGDAYVSNSNGITIDGELIVNGNYQSSNNVGITGSGTMTTTGSIISNNSSSVFGSQNDCTTGPCSGNNLCANNTTTAAQSICSGQTPSQLIGNNLGGYTYKWQQSTTSSSSGYLDISGATNQNYSPGSLTATTWYRRVVTNGSCTATGVGLKMTVNANGSASVNISATATTICSGTSVTFTATPTNGGTTPTYQWKKGGTSISGATTNTYTTTTLANNDAITCTMISNYTCLTGGSSVTSNTLTITLISGSGSWNGITSTDWNTGSNWCSSSVPGSGTNVTLNSGVTRQPTITNSGAQCNDLTINSGATLTVSNTFTINGNLIINSGGKLVVSSGVTINAKKGITNNGTISGSGTIILNGTSNQALSGSGPYGSNITLNNSTGATASSAITLSGYLTLTSGAFTSNGNLSIDLSTGGIAGTGTGSVTGNINVSQNVSSYKYHYLSSPLAGATVADWNDDVTIKTGSYSNLYYYNEAVVSPVSTDGWIGISSISTALTPLKGYALYFWGPVVIDMTGSYTHGASGVPSNVTLTNTASTDVTSDGWNLVGNPYPSAIDWDASSGWTKTGLDNAVYCWDPVNSRYTTYVSGTGTNGGTRYLAPMQAYMVKVTAPGSKSFGCNNSVRVSGVSQVFWKAPVIENELRIIASTGNYSDETVLKIGEDATNSFDSGYDAHKLMNSDNTPNVFTKLDNELYAINTISDTTDEVIVPLHLKGNISGYYTLRVKDIASFNSQYDIILEDTVLHVKQDLRKNPLYACSVNTSDSSARFLIHLKKSNDFGINEPASSNVLIRGQEDNVNIDFLNTSSRVGYIGVFNTMGRKVAEVSNADISSGTYQLSMPGEVGIYIVKVAIGEGIFTKKVFLR